ncbi:helix-turn-helix domain-containing protein [Chryseobacterium sp. MMS23-Vi53]|uniref:helix-turn-helix domain-containing protein n=1 Tax=Chryseobacterium sp. MMS23-Vi53 TaxID=3386644 RepID=UPI0039E88210
MKKILFFHLFLMYGICSSQPPNFGKINRDFIYISLFLSLLLFIYLFGKREQRNIEKQISELANNCEKRRKEFELIKTDEAIYKNSNLSNETANTILKKLVKFEKDQRFLKKDITLTWLASHLGTNTKYLSETIKIHKNKNFNGYINGLRINYITQKLYEDPQYRETKIVSMAKECGYASSQVFVTAFKKENGFSPSFFINNLNGNEIKNHNSN